MKRGGILLVFMLCIAVGAQSIFAQEPPRNLTPDEIQRIMEQERIRRAQEFQTNPGIGISIRRMHDIDQSGLMVLIPIYNIYLACQPGTTRTNRFGPEPRKL